MRSPIKDSKRVDIEDPQEVEAWACLLKVSDAELRQAIDTVGYMSITLAAHFAKANRSSGKALPTRIIGANTRESPSSKRRVVSKETLDGLVRAKAALIPECVNAVCGPVKWRRPGSDGCNWTISKLAGDGCLQCLEKLQPTLDALREHVNLAEPSSDLAKITTRRFSRRVMRPVRTAAVPYWEDVDARVASAKTAARQSRALLRLVKAAHASACLHPMPQDDQTTAYDRIEIETRNRLDAVHGERALLHTQLERSRAAIAASYLAIRRHDQAKHSHPALAAMRHNATESETSRRSPQSDLP